jgi:NifB/MoaA-like Fe-S oxidoreductase
MIGDTLDTLVDSWRSITGVRTELVVVPNRFFGPRVRVSGLLTGGDILAGTDRYQGDVLILPSVMLDKTGARTLDGLTPAELEDQLGKPVRFAGYLSEVDQIIFSLHREISQGASVR